MIHELGEDSLSGIHPSLSAIRAGHGHSVLAPDSAAINFKSKNASYTLSRVICDRYSERPGFSRTLLSLHNAYPQTLALFLKCCVASPSATIGSTLFPKEEHMEKSEHEHHPHHPHKPHPHDPSITIAAYGQGVVITTISGPHIDTVNNPGDPLVRIAVFPNPPGELGRLTAAVIGGREHDCVHGYVVVDNHCFRSPCWQDTTPGVLNLQINQIQWLNEWSFSIAGRGTASFDGHETWTLVLGSGSQYGDGGDTSTHVIF